MGYFTGECPWPDKNLEKNPVTYDPGSGSVDLFQTYLSISVNYKKYK